MISTWHLFWIVPSAIAVGFLVAAWLLTDDIDPSDY